MSKAWRVLFVGFLFASSPVLLAQSTMQIVNIDEISKDLALKNFKGKTLGRKVKIAVLDNGFYGYENELGKTLPKDVVYHKGAESPADKIDNRGLHGLFMAQIVHQVISKADIGANYEMHLFNAFGYTKFEDAVKVLVEEKFDVVLYAQVWEYGGNGDGKGFINTVVNKAVDAGIVWINSAGNFGRLTRLAPVDGKVEGADEWVQFKEEPKLKINCAPKKGELCSLRLVLAWNDFKDDATTGTDKDLDLFLYDAKKKLVGSSERNQKLVSDPTDVMTSLVPRELIETKVPTGTYTIKVKVKSKNFSASQDILRITAAGTGVDLTSPSVGETLLPPADNVGVMVIGASDDFETNRSLKNSKPDIWLKSLVRMKDGSNPYESSNAAAMAAGLAVLHMGTGTEANRAALIEKMKPISRTDQAASEKSLKKELPLGADKLEKAASKAAAKIQTKTDEKVAANTEVQGKPAATEVAKPETVKPPVEKAEAVKTEVAKPAAQKPEPVKVETVKVDVPKTETAKPATEPSEVVQEKEKPKRQARASRPRPAATYEVSSERLPHTYPTVQFLLRNGAGVTRVNGRVAIAVSPGQVDLSNMDDDQIPVISPEGVRFYGPEDQPNRLPSNYYQIVIINK